MSNFRLRLLALACVVSLAWGCSPAMIRKMVSISKFNKQYRPVGRLMIDDLFERDFDGYEPPFPERITQAGLHREYTHASFDDVWNGTLRVLMQRCVIARASKDTGVIFCPSTLGEIYQLDNKGPAGGYWNVDFMAPKIVPQPKFPPVPSAYLLEEIGPEKVIVHADWLEELYVQADSAEDQAVNLMRDHKQEVAAKVFDDIAGEVFAGKRWRHLE